MKKAILIISTLLAVLSVNAQNCYDPYADYIGPNPYLTPLNNPHSYEGEYQFFVDENTASTALTQTRIEFRKTVGIS